MSAKGRAVDEIEDLMLTLAFDLAASLVILLIFLVMQYFRRRKLQDLPSNSPMYTRTLSDGFLVRPQRLPTPFEHSKSTSGVSRGVGIRREERSEFEPQQEPANVFGWVKTLSTIPDEEVIFRCHKDGYLYLLFVKYLYTYFFVLVCGSCGILLPIFMAYSKQSTSLLRAYTIDSVVNETWKLWFVLVLTVLYTLLAFVMLYVFHRRIEWLQGVEAFSLSHCVEQKDDRLPRRQTRTQNRRHSSPPHRLCSTSIPICFSARLLCYYHIMTLDYRSGFFSHCSY